MAAAHHPQTETSLDRWFQNLVPPNDGRHERPGRLRRHGGRGDGRVGDGASTIGRRAAAATAAWAAWAAWRRRHGAGGDAPMAAAADGGGGDAAMAAMASRRSAAMPTSAACSADAGGAGGAVLVQPTVRTKFADTALWVGALTTDNDGTAEVALDMPENLTTWRIKVWGMGHGTNVGQGQTDVVTRKDLIVRLQAPRFFVQTDEVVLSAIVHNYLKTKKTVAGRAGTGRQASLRAAWADDSIADRRDRPPTARPASIGASRSLDEGEAVVRMKALTDEESDAMEQKFPCYIHGMLKMDSFSGAIRPDRTRAASSPSTCPNERRPKQSRLEVRYSPTLAGAMVDALPYLVDYPYGCTEQTLNRFLPTVITQKVLLDMKLDLKDIREEADEPQRPGDRRRRASGPSSGSGYDRNPVFDEDEVAPDGQGRRRAAHRDAAAPTAAGAGSPAGASTPRRTPRPSWSTACKSPSRTTWPWCPACWNAASSGSSTIRTSRCSCSRTRRSRTSREGLRWKESADNLDAFVYMVLVDAGVKNADMLEFLYRDRTNLAVYGMAMYGLALEKQGEKEKLAMILRNIGQYVAAGRREPDGLAQPARGLLVVLVRQRVRGPGLLPEAAGADRSQGRAGPAAGQVSVEQPQARHLLELDPRHGPVHRGHGRLHPRPAARTGRR